MTCCFVKHSGAFLVLERAEVEDSVEVGRRYNMTKRSVVLGNTKAADIQIPSHGEVCYHVHLFQEQGRWEFENKGTPYTIRWNGQLQEAHVLQDGCLLKVGENVFCFFDGLGPLSHVYNRLFELTRIDVPTGTYNKTHFWASLTDWINLSKRNGKALCVLMIDVDYFKKFNDVYGHLAGDKVLQQVAHRLNKRLRRGDVLARYGGEEFSIIVPECSQEKALQLAEVIRKEIGDKPFHAFKQSLYVSISVGVAAYNGKESAESLVHRADQHLLTAKTSGRNCVVG